MNVEARYNKKELSIIKLANSQKKRITKRDIKREALSVGLTVGSLLESWDNFVQFGRIDMRYNGLGKFATVSQKEGQARYRAKLKKLGVNFTKKARRVSSKVAGRIIKEYMTTDIKTYELALKYNISLHQFYGWLRELNVSGTVLKRRVLEPKKYAKIDIKQVIRFNKKPHLFKDISVLKASLYRRLTTVLNSYL